MPPSSPPPSRLRITLSGIVQGVGFRPFLYRLAQELGLAGWVQNCGGKVVIEVAGSAAALQLLIARLICDAPPLSRPHIDALIPLASKAFDSDFQILPSGEAAVPDIHLPMDSHACPDCLRELAAPADRRYRYPFINCTQCGPRYTLIEALPYDRVNTSMAKFPMCERCRDEYENPQDRRFHAEPIACPDCGPQLGWHADGQRRYGEKALQAALHALREGKILAVRGVGGYHLLADAGNATTVARLRERKQRPTRPFALLIHETLAAEVAHADELALLRSAQRPIVLIQWPYGRADSSLAPSPLPLSPKGRGESRHGAIASPTYYLVESLNGSADSSAEKSPLPPLLQKGVGAQHRTHFAGFRHDSIQNHAATSSTILPPPLQRGMEGDFSTVGISHPQAPELSSFPGIAPSLQQMGVMLPYSPLHQLLLDGFGKPLVATSGNLSGEPIAIDPDDAEARLGKIADGFLHHNRPIVRPAEDSVWQVYPRFGAIPLRLGRGMAPLEFTLPHALAEPMLALGGEQKVTLALGWGNRVVISPHIGDLSHPESMALLKQVAEDFCRLFQVQAQRMVVDAHPGFQSRQWALGQGLPLSKIWHHHAHASALAIEHPAIHDWLMLTWDGVGLGPDGSLWGGETLRGQAGTWQRLARLRPFRLPGGEAASHELWRSAAGLLWEVGAATPTWHPQQALLHTAWQRGINSPQSSAVGRLFDAMAALLGVCHHASFEGEGPMLLQALAESTLTSTTWPVHWRQQGDLLELDWEVWLVLLQEESVPLAERARSFHLALANAIAALPVLLNLPDDVPLGLTGGGIPEPSAGGTDP